MRRRKLEFNFISLKKYYIYTVLSKHFTEMKTTTFYNQSI